MRTLMEERAAREARWADLVALLVTIDDPAACAHIIELWATNWYTGLAPSEAVDRLLGESPTPLRALYERGVRQGRAELAQEEARDQAALAALVRDVEGKEGEMRKGWNPVQVEAERRAHELLREESFADAARQRSVEREADALDAFDQLLTAASAEIVQKDGGSVADAALALLAASPALGKARIAAARGVRVPAAAAQVMNKCFRVAVAAPPGAALVAAQKVAKHYVFSSE